MSILSTREWATLIWFLILIVFILCIKKYRESIKKMIILFLSKKYRKVLKLFGVILLYVAVITIFFQRLPIWKIIYIKDIVIWFICSGFMYCVKAASNKADEKYIITTLKDNFKLTIFLEFFMDTFTFNIWAELIIIPIATIIMVLNLYAEKTNENIHDFFVNILAFAGLCMLCKTIKIATIEYKELNIMDTIISFMIPIIYTILIIPLEWTLEIYSTYESLFSRMTFKEGKDIKQKLYHRITVFKACMFSINKITLFRKEYMKKMYVGMKDEDFRQLITEFKNQ